MSDLLINIRIYIYHLQVTKNYKFRFSKNYYHKNNNETPFLQFINFIIIKNNPKTAFQLK